MKKYNNYFNSYYTYYKFNNKWKLNSNKTNSYKIIIYANLI